jgi:hypothetical protein
LQKGRVKKNLNANTSVHLQKRIFLAAEVEKL